MVKSGTLWTGLFVTLDGTRALAAATVGPVGVLYVNGVANAAVVTISGSNPYKFSVTLPTLAGGDVVSMYVTATVGGVATAFVASQDTADTVRLSDVNTVATAIKAVTDAIDLGDTIINMQETVVGGDVTVKAGDTWRITLTDADLDMSAHEVLAFVVKASDRQAETQAQLYVRSDTGLQRINGAAPVAAGNGTLTKDSATAFTVVVHMAETISVNPGFWYWWIKGIDTTPTPDEGTTLASGRFTVTYPGVRAVA